MSPDTDPHRAAHPARPAGPAGARAALRSALFPALPLARVPGLQVLVRAFVILDVLTFSDDVPAHAGNTGFYAPRPGARLLHHTAVTAPLAYAAGPPPHRLRRDPRLAAAAAGAVVTIARTGCGCSTAAPTASHRPRHMALMVAVAVLPTVAPPRPTGGT